MTVKPQEFNWDDLSKGMSVTIPFKICQKDMDTFTQLSGDRSSIHMDKELASANGFSDLVLYGG